MSARPCHLYRVPGDRKTICGLKDDDALPYCALEFAEVHRSMVTPCETCWAEVPSVPGRADTSAVDSPG